MATKPNKADEARLHAWKLDGVKIGDYLIYSVAVGRYIMALIERITATQVICKGGARFWIKDGFAVGGNIVASIATPEDLVNLQIHRRIKAARKTLADIQVTPTNIAAVEALIESIRGDA